MPIHYRGFRELPGPSTRVRGSGDLPYNPRRPLRLPRDRRPRRRPQINPEALLRLLLPVALLVALGVGVFFGVDALLDSGGDGDSATAAVTTPPAGPEADTPADTAPAADADADTPLPIDVDPADAAAADDPAETPAADETEAVNQPPADPTQRPSIITTADLGGAPVVVERGAATPIPPGVAQRTLDDGTPYDPTDASVAFSSLWAAGTVLEITRLPGGPLLTPEQSALLIGKVTRVTVAAVAPIPTELQLSPAAFQLLALDVEPIIALRIEAVGAPGR